MSFEDEGEMLLQWSEFVRQVDPDIVTGYNISNFDWPYLLDRAEALKVTKFPYFSRILGTFHANSIGSSRRFENASKGYPFLVESTRHS